MEFSKKVNLRPIDPERIKIEIVPGSKDQYNVWFELDSIPDQIWTGIFYTEIDRQKQMGAAMISEACITVLASADDFKNKIDWIKKLVDFTNQQVEQHNKRAEEEREEQRKTKEKGEADIKKMREQLRQ
jgi:wobble nucleotide-excising tRNase